MSVIVDRAKIGVVACGLYCLFLSSAVIAADDEIELKGPDVAALCYALKAFKKDYAKADLNHFLVYIETPTDANKAQIAFVPIPEPRKPGELILHFGGGNRFGEEVHYVISRRPFKIVRKFYGK